MVQCQDICERATPANPAPQLSENGEPGKERYIVLELKVLADVGLVGFPSVLGSSVFTAWGFESLHPHYKKRSAEVVQW